MRRIFLIDCPGIVPPNAQDTETDILLRGVVRVENVSNPEQYIPAVLSKCKQQHLERTYEIKGWTNSTEFCEMLARKGGRLLKGGEADMDGVAKMVLNDFMRGKIPWFTPCPKMTEEEEAKNVIALKGREGRLGEMRKKRSAEEMEGSQVASTKADTEVDEDEDEEWGGIASDDGNVVNEIGEGEWDDEDDEDGGDDNATLVADQDTESEEEEEGTIKPKADARKKRKQT